jgi:hypothetical protein
VQFLKSLFCDLPSSMWWVTSSYRCKVAFQVTLEGPQDRYRGISRNGLVCGQCALYFQLVEFRLMRIHVIRRTYTTANAIVAFLKKAMPSWPSHISYPGSENTDFQTIRDGLHLLTPGIKSVWFQDLKSWKLEAKQFKTLQLCIHLNCPSYRTESRKSQILKPVSITNSTPSLSLRCNQTQKLRNYQDWL